MTVVSPYITLVDRNGRLTPEGVRLLQSFVARDAAAEGVGADARLDALETTTAGHTSDISDLIADVAALDGAGNGSIGFDDNEGVFIMDEGTP